MDNMIKKHGKIEKKYLNSNIAIKNNDLIDWKSSIVPDNDDDEDEQDFWKINSVPLDADKKYDWEVQDDEIGGLNNLSDSNKEDYCAPFEVVNDNKLKDGETPLGNVIGYQEQKKEILNVIDWFSHSKELKSKGVTIPKGIILYGEPGNGKSLLIREIIKCCNCPVFIYRENRMDTSVAIYETFTKARKTGHAIVVFDELDLLIDNDCRVKRVLQDNLDGIKTNDDILVLAATNDIDRIPYPLLRSGRLEKRINISYPTEEDSIKLLKKYFDDFNIKFPEDYDFEEAGLCLSGISCADIKAVVNDIVLRNGFENITSEMIDNSINYATEFVKNKSEKENLDVAVHEAGHAVVARSYPEYFRISKLNISGASGIFQAKEIEKGFWPYGKITANIKICMAGVIAQKEICGKGSRGCEIDLQNARKNAYNMFNMCGYSSCWETLPTIGRNERIDTFMKRRKMEKKIERFLKKCEKETTKYVRAHKTEIIKLGNLLLEKKSLKSNEILSVIG